MLVHRLHKGHALITANNRLSRVLNSQYAQWRIGQGDPQWRSPEIYSWSIWLDKLWEIAALQGVTGTGLAVPGNRQQLSLWQQVLKTKPLRHSLLHPESLANQLQETRGLVKTWQLASRTLPGFRMKMRITLPFTIGTRPLRSSVAGTTGSVRKTVWKFFAQQLKISSFQRVQRSTFWGLMNSTRARPDCWWHSLSVAQ